MFLIPRFSFLVHCFLNISFLLLLTATVSQAQQVVLSPSEASTLKEKVLKVASNTQTISSDFVQKKHLDFLSNDIETFGKMIFKAPNLIRWEYTKPYEYSVVFKNNKLYINDGGTKSDVNLEGNKMFQSLNDMIARSIKGDMFDEKEFSIAYFKKDQNYLVKFTPKREALMKYIKQFELTFVAADAQVLAVRMVEPSEDYTYIVFNNRVLNEEVSMMDFSN